jgi:hypothetical protein
MIMQARILAVLATVLGGALLGACAGTNEDDAATAESNHTDRHGSHHGDQPPEDPDEGVSNPCGGGECAEASLPTCAAAPKALGALPTPAFSSSTSSFDPGPLALFGDRSLVFLSSGMMMDVASGSGTTRFRPSPLDTAQTVRAFRSLSGRTAVVWSGNDNAKTSAATFDGTNVGTPIELPCNSAAVANGACSARVAPDGHLWIYASSNLYEQVGSALALRGGPPGSSYLWDVDASGAVVVLSHAPGSAEPVVRWKLAPGAGGWTKAGALPKETASALAGSLGSFDLGGAALAPDGSVHLFSSSRCIGEGERNRPQIHLRSRDGLAWSGVTMPDTDTLYAGHVTWKNEAHWASDYDNVRLVVMSSPPPTRVGYSYRYPDRQFNVLARCRTPEGRASFARVATTRVPGWTDRAFASFSETGAVTLLSRAGIAQLP